MPSEWGEVPIGEIAEIFDGPHATPRKTESGPVFLGISNLVNGRIDLSNVEHLSDDDFARWTRRVEPKAGDVVFSYETRLGEAALVPPGLRCCLGRRMGLLRPRPGKVDSRFLLYAYLGAEFQETLRARTVHGSTVDRISLIDMPTFPVRIPATLQEQQAIAHILGTLDDKIELNRRMSETLEAMARALFKSWFVDFEPVRVKAEGRDPGLPTGLADLFPDRLIDSELGEIPAGWSLAPMGDHFEAVKGVSYKGSGLSDRGTPLHNLNSIYEGGGYKYEGIKYYTGEYAERHVVDPGDVIVANTEQGHDRLLIGYAAIVPATLGERGIASHHLFRVRPRNSSRFTAQYLCWLLNSSQIHDEVSGYANGTTVNMLPVAGLEMPLIVCPPAGLVAAFDAIATNGWRRSEGLVVGSETLAELRDELLPRLVSGALTIAAAETNVR